MSIKKVWVETECTACGLCTDICPEVFEMDDQATVKYKADFIKYEDQIIEAADSCPVEAIKYSE